MELTTLQGTLLTVHLTAKSRIPGGHPEPIVEFRYQGGMLCSSYYLSTFQGIECGLCLEGSRFQRQDLDSAAVIACKAWADSLI
jgi:hypothetical protein